MRKLFACSSVLSCCVCTTTLVTPSDFGVKITKEGCELELALRLGDSTTLAIDPCVVFSADNDRVTGKISGGYDASIFKFGRTLSCKLDGFEFARYGTLNTIGEDDRLCRAIVHKYREVMQLKANAGGQQTSEILECFNAIKGVTGVWTKHSDEKGTDYYYRKATKTSTHDRPSGGVIWIEYPTEGGKTAYSKEESKTTAWNVPYENPYSDCVKGSEGTAYIDPRLQKILKCEGQSPVPEHPICEVELTSLNNLLGIEGDNLLDPVNKILCAVGTFDRLRIEDSEVAEVIARVKTTCLEETAELDSRLLVNGAVQVRVFANRATMEHEGCKLELFLDYRAFGDASYTMPTTFNPCIGESEETSDTMEIKGKVESSRRGSKLKCSRKIRDGKDLYYANYEGPILKGVDSNQANRICSMIEKKFQDVKKFVLAKKRVEFKRDVAECWIKLDLWRLVDDQSGEWVGTLVSQAERLSKASEGIGSIDPQMVSKCIQAAGKKLPIMDAVGKSSDFWVKIGKGEKCVLELAVEIGENKGLIKGIDPCIVFSADNDRVTGKISGEYDAPIFESARTLSCKIDGFEFARYRGEWFSKSNNRICRAIAYKYREVMTKTEQAHAQQTKAISDCFTEHKTPFDCVRRGAGYIDPRLQKIFKCPYFESDICQVSFSSLDNLLGLEKIDIADSVLKILCAVDEANCPVKVAGLGVVLTRGKCNLELAVPISKYDQVPKVDPCVRLDGNYESHQLPEGWNPKPGFITEDSELVGSSSYQMVNTLVCKRDGVEYARYSGPVKRGSTLKTDIRTCRAIAHLYEVVKNSWDEETWEVRQAEAKTVLDRLGKKGSQFDSCVRSPLPQGATRYTDGLLEHLRQGFPVTAEMNYQEKLGIRTLDEVQMVLCVRAEWFNKFQGFVFQEAEEKCKAELKPYEQSYTAIVATSEGHRTLTLFVDSKYAEFSKMVEVPLWQEPVVEGFHKSDVKGGGFVTGIIQPITESGPEVPIPTYTCKHYGVRFATYVGPTPKTTGEKNLEINQVCRLIFKSYTRVLEELDEMVKQDAVGKVTEWGEGKAPPNAHGGEVTEGVDERVRSNSGPVAEGGSPEGVSLPSTSDESAIHSVREIDLFFKAEICQLTLHVDEKFKSIIDFLTIKVNPCFRGKIGKGFHKWNIEKVTVTGTLNQSDEYACSKDGHQFATYRGPTPTTGRLNWDLKINQVCRLVYGRYKEVLRELTLLHRRNEEGLAVLECLSGENPSFSCLSRQRRLEDPDLKQFGTCIGGELAQPDPSDVSHLVLPLEIVSGCSFAVASMARTKRLKVLPSVQSILDLARSQPSLVHWYPQADVYKVQMFLTANQAAIEPVQDGVITTSVSSTLKIIKSDCVMELFINKPDHETQSYQIDPCIVLDKNYRKKDLPPAWNRDVVTGKYVDYSNGKKKKKKLVCRRGRGDVPKKASNSRDDVFAEYEGPVTGRFSAFRAPSQICRAIAHKYQAAMITWYNLKSKQIESEAEKVMRCIQDGGKSFQSCVVSMGDASTGIDPFLIELGNCLSTSDASRDCLKHVRDFGKTRLGFEPHVKVKEILVIGEELTRVLECLKDGGKSFKTCVVDGNEVGHVYVDPWLEELAECLRKSGDQCTLEFREKSDLKPTREVQKVLGFGKKLKDLQYGLTKPLNKAVASLLKMG
jgi:hypothetical protein